MVTGGVNVDLMCRGCGYNLRSLLHSASCPECGVPVASSIRDDQLINANPTWLGRLRTGVGLLILAISLWVLLHLLTKYASLIGLFQSLSLSAMDRLGMVIFLLDFLVVLLPIACLILTTEEPGAAPLARDNLLRKRLRIVAVAYIVFRLSGHIIWSLIVPQFGILSAMKTSVDAIILVAGAYCLFTYLATLVERTPARNGAGSLKLLRYIYLPIMAIDYVVMLVNTWAWCMAPPPSGRMLPMLSFSTSVFMLAGAAGLIATIVLVVFLVRFFFYLDRTWKLADNDWSDREA